MIKKYLFIFLLCLFITTSAYAGRIVTFFSPAPGGCTSGVNDFSGASSTLYGLYHFESGAVSTDSDGGTGTLSTVGGLPTADGTNYRATDGSYSAYFDESNDALRTDTLLGAGNPLKNATGEHDFSITLWLRFDSMDNFIEYPISKYNATNGERQFGFNITSSSASSVPRITYGYTNSTTGDSFTYVCDDSGYTVLAERWYFVHISFAASTNTFHLRMWDDTASSWAVDETEVTAHAPDWGTADLTLMRRDGGTDRITGNLDELTIWDSVVSDSDANLIRIGCYGN